MKHSISNMRIRVLVMIAVVLNILFNNLYQAFPNTQSIESVANLFPTPFTPVSYIFVGLWGLLSAGFLVYAVYEMMPGQRFRRVYYELALPVIISKLLEICWLVVFTRGFIGLSLFIMCGLLFTGAVAFIRARNAVNFGQNTWIAVPFSLFFGWITMAAIANLFTWMASTNWDNGGIDSVSWSMGLLIIAGLFSIVISVVSRDWIYSLVVACSSFALWLSNRYLHPEIAGTAMISGFLLLAWSLGYAVIDQIRRRHLVVKQFLKN